MSMISRHEETVPSCLETMDVSIFPALSSLRTVQPESVGSRGDCRWR